MGIRYDHTTSAEIFHPPLGGIGRKVKGLCEVKVRSRMNHPLDHACLRALRQGESLLLQLLPDNGHAGAFDIRWSCVGQAHFPPPPSFKIR